MTMENVKFLQCANNDAEREMLVLLRDLLAATKAMRSRLDGLTVKLEDAHVFAAAA